MEGIWHNVGGQQQGMRGWQADGCVPVEALEHDHPETPPIAGERVSMTSDNLW